MFEIVNETTAGQSKESKHTNKTNIKDAEKLTKDKCNNRQRSSLQ